MTRSQVNYIEGKVNDIWFVLDREQNEQKISKLCGKLDGIRMVLEMYGYTIICDSKTGRHKVVKDKWQ